MHFFDYAKSSFFRPNHHFSFARKRNCHDEDIEYLNIARWKNNLDMYAKKKPS